MFVVRNEIHQRRESTARRTNHKYRPVDNALVAVIFQRRFSNGGTGEGFGGGFQLGRNHQAETFCNGAESSGFVSL